MSVYQFFEFSRTAHTRRHHINCIDDIVAAASVRSYYFAVRVINVCNSLPVDRVDFSSFVSFKRTVQQIDFTSFVGPILLD